MKMVTQPTVSPRIRLKDKVFDELKLCVEKIVILHDGWFIDENVRGGRVKGKYFREAARSGEDGTDILKFHYTWHNSISDRKAKLNCRKQFKVHLLKLNITQTLPSFKLVNELVGDFNILRKKAAAWESLEDAICAYDIEMEDNLLKTFLMDDESND